MIKVKAVILIAIASAMVALPLGYWLAPKPKPAVPTADLKAENDSLRTANKAIADRLDEVYFRYHIKDSLLVKTLADLVKIKIKYDKIRADHAALPADSAKRVYEARFR